MKSLLSINDLTQSEIFEILDEAQQLIEVSEREIKKVPALKGKGVINLFYENSTRTRTSFELAAKRLSADAVNISAKTSSVSKGETLLDTLLNIQAMSPDIVVLRHGSSGVHKFLSDKLEEVAIINAGDGTNEHPTQALLDCLALRQRLSEVHNGLKIAIVGDIRHSRVAKSNILLHKKLNNEIRLIAPSTLLPKEYGEAFDVPIYRDIREGLKDVDVIMSLRIQNERMERSFISSTQEYCDRYCLTKERVKLASKDALIMHPGPINRGVEISSEVVDCKENSLVLTQVKMGVALRMAVLIRALRD